MGISDWSSDVGSSDLDGGARRQARLQGPPPQRRRQVMTAVTGDRPVAAGNGSWARLARSEALRGFALVSPTFLYALLLLLAPILVIVAFSFWTQDYLTIDRTFTLANYREIGSASVRESLCQYV